nr:DUF6044 family protein [uncultured Flavobacterium sp.]
MNFNLKYNTLFITGIGIILFVFIYFLALNGNAFLGYSWDFYDSNVIWLNLMSKSNYFFADSYTRIDEIMELPRISLGSELNFLSFLFCLFPSYVALVINMFLIQFVAFIGMFLLLENYVFNKVNSPVSVFLISITFSFLAFWQPAGLGVAGIPLMLFTFFKIIHGYNKYLYYSFLFILPFYSSLIFSGIFLLATSFILICILFKYHKLSKNQFSKGIIILAILFILYLISEYRLIIDSFSGNANFISHRLEFVDSNGFKESILKIYSFLMAGQGHTISRLFPIIYFSILVLLLFKKRSVSKVVLYLIFTIVLIAIFHGFHTYAPFVSIKSKLLGGLASLQLDRFYTLVPFLSYLLFGFIILQLIQHNNFTKIVAYFLLFFQFLFVFNSSIFFIDIKDKIIDKSEVYTFNEYFARGSFDIIKSRLILEDKDRVGSVGIDPSVAVFNGLKAIDGYSANYSLKYKHKFRKLIEKELDKNKETKLYFDNWGSRCYIFDDQLGTNFNIFKSSDNKYKPIELHLNKTISKELNLKYIISSVEISNSDSFRLICHFEDKLRVYYLYEFV